MCFIHAGLSNAVLSSSTTIKKRLLFPGFRCIIDIITKYHSPFQIPIIPNDYWMSFMQFCT